MNILKFLGLTPPPVPVPKEPEFSFDPGPLSPEYGEHAELVRAWQMAWKAKDFEDLRKALRAWHEAMDEPDLLFLSGYADWIERARYLVTGHNALGDPGAWAPKKETS